MKKLLFLFALSLCSLAAWAYDFSAVAPSGQRLYYKITSSTAPLTVEVTYPGSSTTIPWPWPDYDSKKPTGSLNIPSSVWYQGNPYAVTTISNSAFYGCSGLTSVTIPNSVTTIGNNAFGSCSGLTSVTIGNSVNSILSWAFSNCAVLTSIIVESGNTRYDSRENCNAVIETATNTLVIGCKNTTIPNSVTDIGVNAFNDCTGLTNVTIPNSVITIGLQAFSGCSGLTNVTIGNSVINIGQSAFYGCIGLTSVTIPNSVTTIGGSAFYDCIGLTSVTIPNSVTTISNSAFKGCTALTSIVVESGNTLYDSRENCNAVIETATNTLVIGCKNTTIPNSVTSIGNYAFYGCSGLTSVTIPNSVTSIGDYAFDGCSGLTSVTIPDSVISIGDDAFYGCSGLTSVTIPNSVTSIGGSAFSACGGLTSVTIGNSVTSIGSGAFNYCSGLTNVNFTGTIAEWCGISFGSSSANPTYYAHTLSFNGMPMGNTLTIPDSVISIGSYAFYNCSRLTSVTIPNSVTSIGSYAFTDCSNLKTVYNLSSLSIIRGTTTNGYVAYYAKRVVNCTEHSGSGDNIIYKIPTTFTIVDNDASTYSTQIPRSTIPTNFIYRESGVWKAKNIVLTDGQDAFEAPETFTAETATYTREFTNSNRSTLYLPFTAAIPENFEVYDFTSFTNNTISFTKREDSIYAYTPYLVGYDLSKDGNTTTCTITKTNAVFPKSESANYHPVTHDDMTFSGVISRTQMTSTNNYGYSNGFFVQSGGSAHVNPFRCYFTYSPSGNAPQSLPPTLNVEVGYGDPVGIDAVETPEQEYDGRYGKDVYDMLGRLVRKNADNLEGLPKGVYIWKGKKIMNYDL